MTAELSMTVIRMTVFIAPQSPSVVIKLYRAIGLPVLFPNDLYVSQSEPFKLHRLCASSHTVPQHSAVRSPKDSEGSALDVSKTRDR